MYKELLSDNQQVSQLKPCGLQGVEGYIQSLERKKIMRLYSEKLFFNHEEEVKMFPEKKAEGVHHRQTDLQEMLKETLQVKTTGG